MTDVAPPANTPAHAFRLLSPEREALAGPALNAACAILGVDPARAFEVRLHMAARARLTAACALADRDRVQAPGTPTAGMWAERFAVHPVSLSPSQRVQRGVAVAMLAAVTAHLNGAALPERMPEFISEKMGGRRPKLPAPDRPAIDARKAEREARGRRIIAARKAGVGPTEIAEREKCARSVVSKTLAAAGETFPRLRAGPQPGAGAGDPSAPKPRAPRARAAAQVERPKPEAPKPEVLTPFPDSHPAWAPLPGSSPVPLVAHRTGCRWPVTVEGERAPHVCNGRTTVHGLYCERHRWLSLPVSVRRDESRLRAAA